MPVIPQQLNQPKLLIGEGQDEVLFFRALLKHLNINNVQVEAYNGKNNLTPYLRTLNEPRPGFRDVISLGITRDADGYDTIVQHDSGSRAFQSIQDALNHAKLPVPELPMTPAGQSVRVSVFVLPDCINPGMLEDLCLASIEDSDAFACISSFMSCIENTGTQMPNNMAKARLHAWLSTQQISDFRLGHAAQQGVWQWNHSKFDKIKEFLRNL